MHANADDSNGVAPGAARKPRQDVNVLLVDPTPTMFDTLVEAVGSEGVLFQADSAETARQIFSRERIDLALIEPDLPDGGGLELAAELRNAQRNHAAQFIVLTEQPTIQQAVEAIRLGACDLIIKPASAADLAARVRQAIARTRAARRINRRIGRLRRVCRKLSAARTQVTQQVDILCNDLVNAYQELASQMQQIAQTNEYANAIDGELDLEALLRKTLEYLLEKAGPTNAAVFLPSSEDEYTVGAYVNYDTTAEAAQMLLQHLADVLAPRVAQHDAPVHVTDNQTLAQWIGDDGAYLADSHVLAFAARKEDESLAVVALFRDQAEPFSQELVEACATVATVLADYLSRIIRIHHRHLPDDYEDGDEADPGYNQAA